MANGYQDALKRFQTATARSIQDKRQALRFERQRKDAQERGQIANINTLSGFNAGSFAQNPMYSEVMEDRIQDTKDYINGVGQYEGAEYSSLEAANKINALNGLYQKFNGHYVGDVKDAKDAKKNSSYTAADDRVRTNPYGDGSGVAMYDNDSPASYDNAVNMHNNYFQWNGEYNAKGEPMGFELDAEGQPVNQEPISAFEASTYANPANFKKDTIQEPIPKLIDVVQDTKVQQRFNVLADASKGDMVEVDGKQVAFNTLEPKAQNDYIVGKLFEQYSGNQSEDLQFRESVIATLQEQVGENGFKQQDLENYVKGNYGDMDPEVFNQITQAGVASYASYNFVETPPPAVQATTVRNIPSVSVGDVIGQDVDGADIIATEDNVQVGGEYTMTSIAPDNQVNVPLTENIPNVESGYNIVEYGIGPNGERLATIQYTEVRRGDIDPSLKSANFGSGSQTVDEIPKVMTVNLDADNPLSREVNANINNSPFGGAIQQQRAQYLINQGEVTSAKDIPAEGAQDDKGTASSNEALANAGFTIDNTPVLAESTDPITNQSLEPINELSRFQTLAINSVLSDNSLTEGEKNAKVREIRATAEGSQDFLTTGDDAASRINAEYANKTRKEEDDTETVPIVSGGSVMGGSAPFMGSGLTEKETRGAGEIILDFFGIGSPKKTTQEITSKRIQPTQGERETALRKELLGKEQEMSAEKKSRERDPEVKKEVTDDAISRVEESLANYEGEYTLPDGSTEKYLWTSPIGNPDNSKILGILNPESINYQNELKAAIDKYGFPPADSAHRAMAEVFFGAPSADQEKETNKRVAEAKPKAAEEDRTDTPKPSDTALELLGDTVKNEGYSPELQINVPDSTGSGVTIAGLDIGSTAGDPSGKLEILKEFLPGEDMAALDTLKGLTGKEAADALEEIQKEKGLLTNESMGLSQEELNTITALHIDALLPPLYSAVGGEEAFKSLPIEIQRGITDVEFMTPGPVTLELLNVAIASGKKEDWEKVLNEYRNYYGKPEVLEEKLKAGNVKPSNVTRTNKTGDIVKEYIKTLV